MGVATGCGFKEIYRFPHTTYPYSSCICTFWQQHPYFFFHFVKMILRSLYIYHYGPSLSPSHNSLRAILSLPWTTQHQFNTRNTATSFTWLLFVVAQWVRVYSGRSQSTAPLSILPKVVGKNFETRKGAPSFMRCETVVGTEKRRRLISVSLHAINYKHGARGEFTYFNHRARGLISIT